MYFFDDEDSLDAELCSSFLGDGVSMQSTKNWQYGRVLIFAKLNAASNHSIFFFFLHLGM